MAVTSRGRTELQMPKKWKEREVISPERTKVWTELKPRTERKVPVVYYLCRSGSLEHPHFMEVPLSSNEGLYLRDVINRLNLLRGKGMASMYSWSSKRSYKNGFVWQDLSENDFIYPAHGQEYVLKGSELLEAPLSFGSNETLSSSSSLEKQQQETQDQSGDDCDFPVVVRRRNQSWSSIDLHEYKVYKAESSMDSAGKAADASTQTDDKRRRRRIIREEEEEIDEVEEKNQYEENQTTELSREEISPPPSSSSPETLENLIKVHRRVVSVSAVSDGLIQDQSSDIRDQTPHPSGRIKASAVLMQLISCGTTSCTSSMNGPHTNNNNKDQGFSLISYYKSRLPRSGGASSASHQSSGGSGNHKDDVGVDCLSENPSFSRIQLEDKEYFSGSLIETKKDEFSALKRSSSYNADRSSKLVLREKEIDGVRAKCIPRKPKTFMKKQSSFKNDINNNNNNLQGGSKRHMDESPK